MPHFSNYVLVYNEDLPGACDRGTDCPLNAFTDLDKTAWYHDGAHWALEKGVMNGVIQGTGENKLSAKQSATRAQVATMLMRYDALDK